MQPKPRRSVLKGIGAASLIGATSVVRASKPKVKVITEKRDFDNQMNQGHIKALQKHEFNKFVNDTQSVVGSVDTNQNIVGLVAAINKDGKTKQYIGSAGDEPGVEKVHEDVQKYATKFEEEL